MASGPNVATSATGRLLAQGPAGPAGPAGQQGAAGQNGSSGGPFPEQSVGNGGTLQANNGCLVFANAAAGPVTIIAPPFQPGGATVFFGITDDGAFSGSPFSATLYGIVPNANGNIEDPNVAGKFSTNPIKLFSPGQTQFWQSNPSGTYLKALF